MSFKDAVITCFKKYATFSGRARRSEYWYFMLFNFIVSTALGLIFDDPSHILYLFTLAIFLPGMSVSWRRLHDIGKSGAFYFLLLIPLVGPICMLVWYCRDSQPSDNAYGVNPKKNA